MATRRLLQWLGSTLMDYNFMRSSRVIFMPVTYNGPTMQFYPETDANGSRYTNTIIMLLDASIKKIHGRAADESRHEAVDRPQEHLAWTSHLLDAAAVHDRDA